MMLCVEIYFFFGEFIDFALIHETFSTRDIIASIIYIAGHKENMWFMKRTLKYNWLFQCTKFTFLMPSLRSSQMVLKFRGSMMAKCFYVTQTSQGNYNLVNFPLNDSAHLRETYIIYISIQLFTHFYANNTFSMMSTNDKQSLYEISGVSRSTIYKLNYLLEFFHLSLHHK